MTTPYDSAMTALAEYTLADLERLEAERPELGKVEILDGTLVATGDSVTGNRHQAVALVLTLLLARHCPDGFVVRPDTHWSLDRPLHGRTRLRPDIGVWRATDQPTDGGAFRVAPVAVVEVLSDDADHDLVRKDPVYRDAGVTALYVDPRERSGWWARIGAAACVDVDEPALAWAVPGWPPLRVERDAVLAAGSGG